MTAALSSFRRRVAPAAKTLLLRAGGYRAIRVMAPSRKLAILRYHAICGPEGYAYADPAICISPEAFERHVQYLTSQYVVLPLPEATRRLKSGAALPVNAVAITFDDGYADNLDAARVLHRYGATATFYLTTDCLADGQPFWPTELRTLVARLPGPSLTVSTPRAMTLPLDTDGARYKAVKALTRLCKSNPIPVREALRQELRRLANVDAAPTPTMLTWGQVREMVDLGMDMGGHTLTHTNLPSAGRDDAWREIDGCRRALHERVGVAPTQFSYPNGGAETYHTPELHAMVERAGFEASATSSNGFASEKSDPYALERVEVEERLEDLVFALEVERFVFRPAGGPLGSAVPARPR
jgi:peptidoglycan/xylan/chitin deacetylase (PgdA/CDA1 family)